MIRISLPGLKPELTHRERILDYPGRLNRLGASFCLEGTENQHGLMVVAAMILSEHLLLDNPSLGVKTAAGYGMHGIVEIQIFDSGFQETNESGSVSCGIRVCEQIQAIADGGMLVMGHIGLTPQSSGQQGGFKAQGRTAEAAKEVIDDAVAIENAGAFALLVEAVPPEVCGIIRERLKIPVYSIGAGWEADGQLMICSDVLGIFQAFTPKFVKKYENLGEKTINAFKQYAHDARNGQFPKEEHAYKMVDGELPKLKQLLDA